MVRSALSMVTNNFAIINLNYINTLLTVQRRFIFELVRSLKLPTEECSVRIFFNCRCGNLHFTEIQFKQFLSGIVSLNVEVMYSCKQKMLISSFTI